MLKPVTFKPAYNPSNNSVTLTIPGKQSFATGGQITVINSSPTGVSSADGVLLAGATRFTISRNAQKIMPG